MSIIDHDRVMDGHGQLLGYTSYVAFETYCGICDAPFLLTAADQKRLLEKRGVPVKMLRRGAAFCAACAKRRGRINYLKRGQRFLEVEGGREELAQLEAEERADRAGSSGRYESAAWPYRE